MEIPDRHQPGNGGARIKREIAIMRDPKSLDDILTAVADKSGGLVAWCRERDVRYRIIHGWMLEDTDRARQLDIARTVRGAVTEQQLDSLVRRTEAGKSDPKILAAVSKPMQWLAAVRDRKRYGQTLAVDHKHSLSADHLAALKQAMSVHQPQLAALTGGLVSHARGVSLRRETEPALAILDAEFASIDAVSPRDPAFLDL